MKLNHNIVNYAAFKLDKQNLLVNKEYMVFNFETKEEINFEEVKKNIKNNYLKKEFNNSFNSMPLYADEKSHPFIKTRLSRVNAARKFLTRIALFKFMSPLNSIGGHERYFKKELNSSFNSLSLYTDERFYSFVGRSNKANAVNKYLSKLALVKAIKPLDLTGADEQNSNYNEYTKLKRKSRRIISKNFNILNKLENKSKILDASNLLFDLMPYFNYNAIKKKNAEHAIALTIIHYGIFNEIQTQEAYDVLNKKYKIFMFFILSCIDKKLCFI